MKYIIVLSLCLVMVFSSCQKQEVPPTRVTVMKHDGNKFVGYAGNPKNKVFLKTEDPLFEEKIISDLQRGEEVNVEAVFQDGHTREMIITEIY